MRNYCPQCRQETSLHENGICPWCDTPLRIKTRDGALSERHLRVLYELKQRGYTVKAIAQSNYRAWGYSSANTCQNAISLGWRRLELSSQQGRPAKAKADA